MSLYNTYLFYNHPLSFFENQISGYPYTYNFIYDEDFLYQTQSSDNNFDEFTDDNISFYFENGYYPFSEEDECNLNEIDQELYEIENSLSCKSNDEKNVSPITLPEELVSENFEINDTHRDAVREIGYVLSMQSKKKAEKKQLIKAFTAVSKNGSNYTFLTSSTHTFWKLEHELKDQLLNILRDNGYYLAKCLHRGHVFLVPTDYVDTAKVKLNMYEKMIYE